MNSERYVLPAILALACVAIVWLSTSSTTSAEPVKAGTADTFMVDQLIIVGDRQVTFHLANGNTVQGTCTTITPGGIVIRTGDSVFTVPMGQVVAIESRLPDA